MKKYAIAVFLLLSLQFVAQDLHFSQYLQVPVHINPALTAVSHDIRVVANYKDQWNSAMKPKPYRTFGATAEFALKRKKLKKSYWTTGLNIYRDIAAESRFQSVHAAAILGVVIRTGRYGFFSMGLTGGFDVKSIRTDDLRWENQYDGFKYNSSIAGESIPQNQFIYGDFGGGINYHYSKSRKYISANDGHRFDIGAAVQHANIPYYSFYKNSRETMYMKFVQYTSVTIALPDAKLNVIPSYYFAMQGKSREINAGLLLKYIISDESVHSGTLKPIAFAAGATYRYMDAFVPQILFEYDRYAFGMSYDVNLSSLTPSTRTKGGMEICLRYNYNYGYGLKLGNDNRPKGTPHFE